MNSCISMHCACFTVTSLAVCEAECRDCNIVVKEFVPTLRSGE